MHGEDDQIVPIAAAGEKAAKIVAGAEPKVCKRAPHGLYQTMADRIDADRLAVIET